MDEQTDKKLAQVQETIEQFEDSNDYQRGCTAEATKLWQQAHNQPDTLPDIGVLINWLALEIENKQYTITCAAHEIADLRELLAEARAEIERLKNEHENSLDKAKNYTLELSGATTKQAGELADKDRQLTEARAEIERLKQELRDNSTLAARQIVPAEMLVDDLAAEIERKDKLIEQMREALKLASLYIPDNATDAIRISEAALSAAERSK